MEDDYLDGALADLGRRLELCAAQMDSLQDTMERGLLTAGFRFDLLEQRLGSLERRLGTRL